MVALGAKRLEASTKEVASWTALSSSMRRWSGSIPRADADEVVVGVDDSEARGVDVAVDGADYTHGFLLQTGFFEQVMAGSWRWIAECRRERVQAGCRRERRPVPCSHPSR